MEEHSQSETTMSSQFKKKLKETELASKSKNKLGNARKETTNEEYGNTGIQEGENVETEKQEKKQKEKVPMEEDQKNETQALEEYDDEGSEMEEEEEDIEEDEGEEGGLEEAKVEESEEKAIEQAKNKEQVERNSEKQSKISRMKKVAGRGSKTGPTNLEEKPGPLSKKKVSKKAASMGMIFMCSSKTKKDCFQYRVFGLPAGKKDMVQKVYKGMRLFLFDVDLRLMYGIYKAATPGGYNIEPKAFKSAFPSQVRFSVLEDCLPLPEEKFKTIIKDNYFTRSKFDCQLTSEQVKKLCKLFVSAGKVSKSKNPGRTRDKPKQRIRDEKKRARFGADYPLRGHQDQVMYEREVFAPKTAPSRHLPPPAPLHASHARPREMEAYGRDAVIEHRRRPLHLGSRHLDEVEEHRPRILDLGPRHLDEVDEHRGRLLDLGPRHPDEVVEIRRRLLDFGPRHQDEFRSYDPYVSYGDRPPSYLDDPMYSARRPEYSSHPRVGLHGEYPRISGSLPEDRYPEGPSSEYASRRSLYRY
ncbi:uncharacterized protein LOC127798902 [Diospyros lotus]|uniref:uncharacterized protein LOC127798902 n=1 Tax=Diospyros lotus TaxID=55363 RepID=UPI002253CDC6|nr:uncharacterized protein LOC127798902 [Diospyros lotus]XP_052188515.1 uncharacterized protein LOC127798902 [Diospyros lotus]XP_052188523.1 uncharacterized protein LOC127798902 [Diospyros lotus]XP_052188531.1 uncharacterized protein LOC127798902 [Diospyros lotus]XP_052188540.1 uncharacterized protein LOC127798902 [Diospyros lotus]